MGCSKSRTLHVLINAQVIAFFSELKFKRLNPELYLNYIILYLDWQCWDSSIVSPKHMVGIWFLFWNNFTFCPTGADQTGSWIHCFVKGHHRNRSQTASRDLLRHSLLHWSGKFLRRSNMWLFTPDLNGTDF